MSLSVDVLPMYSTKFLTGSVTGNMYSTHHAAKIMVLPIVHASSRVYKLQQRAHICQYLHIRPAANQALAMRKAAI